MSLADEILAVDDSEREPISLPKWTDKPVFIRVMSGTERDDFEASMVEQRGKSMKQNLANVRAKLAVRCLVDEEGNRIFTDEQAVALGKKSGAVLQEVFEAARRLNRLSNDDVEELAKNS